MGLYQSLRDFLAGNRNIEVSNTVRQEISSNRFRFNPLCSDYENLFPQVRPLIDELITVRPFGKDSNGKRLDLVKTPELELLNHPNMDMGWADFASTMFAVWLTCSRLDIHVHFDKRRRKILAYTLVPVGSAKVDSNGQEYFETTLTNGEVMRLSSDDVMTLRYSRSPLNFNQGVSPASTVSVWAQIDDLVAQYERAFFENGAVPATITLIKASTREKYERKRRDLEAGLKGADNKNKTLYVWRQMLDDGTSGDEIEVKTIQGNNSTLALKELIDVINDRLNKATGVSNFILGDDSSAKYDNAELSDRNFTKRRVYPALINFWSQFQHELDRITGGLGYAIDFHLDIPELTDRLKVRAETNKNITETLVEMIRNGGLPSASTKALGLGDEWLAVADGFYHEKRRLEASAITTDKLPEKVETEHHKCEHTNDLYKPVWQPGDEKVKEVYDLLMRVAFQIAREDENIDIDKVSEEIYVALKSCANDGAVAGADTIRGLEFSNEEAKDFVTGVAKDKYYNLSATFTKTLENRAKSVVGNFRDVTKDIVAETLAEMAGQGLTQRQVANRLREALPRYYAEQIARCETHSAINGGRYDLDKYMGDEYGLELELVWLAHIDDKTCPVCREMDGKVVKIGESFPEYVMHDGVEYSFDHNEFNDGGRQPNAHVYCRCTFNERVSIKK